MTGCHDPHFFKNQARILQKCIEEHRWYLSEQAQHDVGLNVAMDSFCEKYFNGFAAGFRACYCGLVCRNRGECDIGRRYAATPEVPA